MADFNPKVDWQPNDPVTEDDFNRIEQGIADAHEKANIVSGELDTHKADDTLHLRADERDAWTSDRVKGSVRLTVSDTEPSNPNVNDIWIDISE